MRHERAILAGFLLAAFAVLAGCGSGTSNSVVKKEDPAAQRADAARVLTDLGQQYMRQGKLELALEKLKKALEFDPDYVDAHSVLGLLYEKIGDLKGAEEQYRRAAQLKPKGGAENNNYGAFLCKIGRYDEAQDYFKRAIADPFYQTPAVALTNSGTCLLKAGHQDQAEAALRDAVRLDPNDPDALLQLGLVLYEKGDYFNASAFVQRFEALSPPRPDALLLGRNIELHLGNAEAAKEYTRKLMQGFPDSPQANSLSSRG